MENEGVGLMMSSTVSRRASDGVSNQFPAGLRVLVMDEDPICLRILEKMLKFCRYEVTTCSGAKIALSKLREGKRMFDIVIIDVHMPDMDGFKLLEHIGLEMDLPVIMMSADDGKDVVIKAVTHGACDYLIKPVRIEALKNIWQHVIRKRRNELKTSGSFEEGNRNRKPSENADYASSANEGSWRSTKKRKDEEDDGEDRDGTSALKKPRVVWSVELHQQFVAAVNQLGIDKAVPKKILELMNVPGLTRENVANHLQKYRLYLRRLSGVSQRQSGLNQPFMGSQEANFGPISSLSGIDLKNFGLHQDFASSGKNGLDNNTPVFGNSMVSSGENNKHGNPESIPQCHNYTLKVKTESVSNSALLPTHYCQDDLMSTLLKQAERRQRKGGMVMCATVLMIMCFIMLVLFTYTACLVRGME